ncbi:MAG: efflux RND transporter periplasmic adaptor subunit [Saprospiraceae bacterium]|nr:efflux RND transporter periplasmic adaptor subunit [Saprospiraceae bacterium]
MGCKPGGEQETTRAELRDISEYVYASVEIVSERTQQCKTPISGIIQNILVERGQKVSSGELLFTITPTADLRNRLSSAELALKDAKDKYLGDNNNLRSIEIEIQRTRENNVLDSINYERKARLWREGIGSENELDQLRLKYQNSGNLLRAQQLQYKQRQAELANAYALAQNRLQTERKLLRDYQVRSEIDGVVFTVFKEKGELILPQEVFAEIGSDDSYVIEMNIDEVDIAKIEVGDTAAIQLEAYGDVIFQSVLRFISATKDASTQTFEVEGAFVEAPSKLYNGLSGEANILVAKRKDAWVIPSEYVRNKNSVLTTEGTIDVKIGVKTLEFVEVLEGIDSSMVLLKPEE